MLAGVRNVAWGAAIVMAGYLAVELANCLWVILTFFPSPSDAHHYFFGPWFFDKFRIDPQHMWDSLLGLAVVIWLIAIAIRRASRAWVVR